MTQQKLTSSVQTRDSAMKSEHVPATHTPSSTVVPGSSIQQQASTEDNVGCEEVSMRRSQTAKMSVRRSQFSFAAQSFKARAFSVLSSVEAELSQGGRYKSTLHTGPHGAHLIERSTNEEVFAIMQSDPLNSLCADCKISLGSDAWAAVNHGIFLCIRCCGVHRSLGTHISQCRSIDLDDWTAEQVVMMHGNRASNAVLEAHFPRGYQPPTFRDPLAFCRDFIQAKYVRKEFSRCVRDEPTLQTYSLASDKVAIAKCLRSRPIPTSACIVGGVAHFSSSSWTTPNSVFVSLDGDVECCSKSAQVAPQDRPVDSRVLLVRSITSGKVLLELEMQNATQLVCWMKALRGSATLGTRSPTASGWWTTNMSTFRRRVQRWTVLHPSGLYFFKTGSVGSCLPQTATSGLDYRNVVLPQQVQGIESGSSRREYMIIIRATDRRELHLYTKEEYIRDEWLKHLYVWAGLDGSDIGPKTFSDSPMNEKLPVVGKISTMGPNSDSAPVLMNRYPRVVI